MFTTMFTPPVALTSQGVAFVAWNEADDFSLSHCGQIWVNRNAAGAWGAPTRVDIRGLGIAPSVAANASGDAVVVWEEREFTGANCTGGITGNEIWASRYSAASNAWSTAVRVSADAPPNSTLFAFEPAVTLDAAGRAMAIWIQDDTVSPISVWFSRFDGTSWSAPALLSNGTRNTNEPTLAIDGSGNVIAVWSQNTNQPDPSQSGGGPQIPNMWSARFDATAGSWSTPGLIGSADLTGFDGTERPRLAVNAGGAAVAAWEETRSGITSIVAARLTSGTWSAPVPLETTNDQQASFPAAAIDVNGNAQVVWVQKIDSTEANNSGYTARFDAVAGTWGAAQLFEQSANEASFPQVGMEDSGRALIAWRESGSVTQVIHAAHFTPASGFEAPTDFGGDNLALAVNAGGTALLASPLTTLSPTLIGISIHAEMFRP